MEALLEQIKELSIEDLRILNKFVIETVNAKKDIESFQVGTKLKVGMTVKVNSSKVADKEFIVQKINRKKAILRLKDTFTDYDVPFSIIIIE